MANRFQSVNSGLAELQIYYQGPIRDQFNEELPVFRAAEKLKKGWSGLQVNRPLRVRRNQGIGATSDGGVLPAIGRQTTVQAVITAAYNYLRFGITGPMIKASQSDVASFVRSASYELEMGYKDLKNDMNRQSSWDGTGTMALVNANSVGTQALVIKGRETGAAALQFVDVGFTFDIISGTSTVVASGIEVTAVSGTPSGTTATLTLSAPVTCSAGDRLVRANSNGLELAGLLYALDGGTTTIYSVDRSLYPAYQGNAFPQASAQLTLNAMQQAYNAGLQRGGTKYDAIYCDFDSLRFYQKLLTADKRYVNTVKGDGGFAEKDKFYLDFNGVPIVPDKDCPQRLFFISNDCIKNYVLCDMEFADETGSMYIAQDSADALEARIRYFSNLFNEQPNACAVMSGYISP